MAKDYRWHSYELSRGDYSRRGHGEGVRLPASMTSTVLIP